MDALVAYAPTFAAVFLVTLIGWATPGPNMLAVASSAVTHGRRAGVTTGLGIAAGGVLWAGLAVAGVGVVFETLPVFFLILKLLGAAYLIWMGLRLFRANRAAVEATTAPPRPFWFGLGVVLTNPKAILFHGALLAAMVPADAPVWLLFAIVAWTQGLAAINHAITAHIFSTRLARHGFDRLGGWANRVFGSIFIALGGAVIWQSLRRTGE